MKPINIVMAVVGGVVAGAAVGLLFAPDKGSNTRTKIADAVKKAGIKLNPKKMDELVDDITEDHYEIVNIFIPGWRARGLRNRHSVRS